MTLLPVVEREMRVAARETNTYRVRFLAALLTVAFSGFSLWFVTLFKAQPIPPRELFLALTWIEFVFVMIAGFSLTADAISEEKREATLGLLFLTDLRGYDIVLGKLATAAIRGIFALIGTFPILALPLMMGGTNGPEFARTTATLLMVLFFSMAVGLIFSTLLQKGWTAYGLSAAVVVAFGLGLIIVKQFIQEFYRRPDIALYVQLPSPSYALYMSFAYGWGISIRLYYYSVAIISGLSLLMLIGSALILPHVWKERAPKAGKFSIRRFLTTIKLGTAEFRPKLRRRLLDLNPVYWLSRREVVSALGFLLLIALAGLFNLYIANRTWPPAAPPEARLILPFAVWVATACMIHGLILLRIPMVAAERFGEDRKSGALELLISTPMSIREILCGHWMGLRRYFAGPCLAALLVHALAIVHMVGLQPLLAGRAQGFTEMLRDIVLHVQGISIHRNWENNIILLIMLGAIPLSLLGWTSLSYFATYLSLRVKRPLGIPMISLVTLFAPPGLAVGAVFAVMEYNKWRFDDEFSAVLFYLTLAFIFEAAAQFFWIRWSRRQLLRQFRTAATDRYQPPKPRRWWQMRIA